MPSKYLEQNSLYISDPIAIARIHELFLKKDKSKLPASKYQKSDEEVMKFLKRKL